MPKSGITIRIDQKPVNNNGGVTVFFTYRGKGGEQHHDALAFGNDTTDDQIMATLRSHVEAKIIKASVRPPTLQAYIGRDIDIEDIPDAAAVAAMEK